MKKLLLTLSLVLLLCAFLSADILRTHANGNKKIEGTLLNGQLEGVIKKFTADGKLIEQAHYSANELHGERQKYFASGALERREYFVNGKIEGDATVYYESGKVALQLNYAGGKMLQYRSYKEDGTPGLFIDYTKK